MANREGGRGRALGGKEAGRQRRKEVSRGSEEERTEGKESKEARVTVPPLDSGKAGRMERGKEGRRERTEKS